MKKTAPKIGLAACTFELTANGGRIQLLPDGKFSAVDGRPHDVPGGKWLLDQAAADMVIAAAKARANPLVIDYEHQTLLSEKNGQPAPAAGWMHGAEFEYVPGEGLFANNPQWVGLSADWIKNQQYRFFSSVFHYDRASGRVQVMRHGALTNDPGIDGMNELVAALKRQSNTENDQVDPTETTGEIPMNELLKKLLAKLGIQISETDFADEAKLQELVNQAIAAIDDQKTKSDTATTEVAALKASQGGEPDPLHFVPIAVANELRGQLVALKSSSEAESVDSLIAKAKEDGRLVEAEEKWARDMATRHGVVALKSNLDLRPSVAALRGLQTTTQTTTQTDKAVLTTEELAVCKAMGLDPEAFKASRVV